MLYRFVLVCLVSALPLLCSAAGSRRSNSLTKYSGQVLLFLDSTGKKPLQERNDKKPNEKKPDDKKPDHKKPTERPDVIKEVPRSRKLPKPAVVRDRVRIKRPPVVRPGGGKQRLGFY